MLNFNVQGQNYQYSVQMICASNHHLFWVVQCVHTHSVRLHSLSVSLAAASCFAKEVIRISEKGEINIRSAEDLEQ